MMSHAAAKTKIKCVVWDLDNTLWEGVLLESETEMTPRPEALALIEELDRRGILQSIASRNEHELACAALERLGLLDYFLAPQINWGAKSQSLSAVADALNIGLDTFAFIDDQPFEREEVASVHPQVRVFGENEIEALASREDFNPLYVTEDSKQRRALYQRDAQRRQAQENFDGPEESFLRSLDMCLSLAPAQEKDLFRAEELTVRTNQLNTTGVTYSVDDLRALIASPDHSVVIAELSDRYGSYGAIGLVLISLTQDEADAAERGWCIDLFLMSCRVMSRGVGGVILSLLRRAAHNSQRRLLARFKQTDRNRMMYVTYRFAGFSERDDSELLINSLSEIPAIPDTMALSVDAALGWDYE